MNTALFKDIKMTARKVYRRKLDTNVSVNITGKCLDGKRRRIKYRALDNIVFLSANSGTINESVSGDIAISLINGYRVAKSSIK
jgi:hypothetical protein